MTSDTSPDTLYKSAPVIAFERSITNIWTATNISPNNTQFGVMISLPDHETDILSHIFPDDQDLVSRKVGAAILQKRSFIEFRYRILSHKNYRWVEEHCAFSYNETGELTRAMSYIWMSTLPVEWALLAKGSEVWNALNSKIRHDILNQLTAILGYLELSTDLITDPMLIDFTKKEQNAAEKTRDRLIFTREYQKIGLLEFSWVNLTDIIKESLNEILLDPKIISIQTGETAIFVDKNFRLALEKILTNIPEHAVGANEVIIQIQPSEMGGVLSIEDNGCGIPDNQKNRIFDLGYGKGNGYGLFLAEKIMGVFGITIQENGIPGKGARFELSIPSYILDIRS